MTIEHIWQSMSAPANDGDSSRPMMWVPGLIYVSPAGHVRWGSDVGYSSLAPTLRGLTVGYERSMTNWMHAAWLVERSSLTPNLVADHALILPETLLDRVAMPAAHRWLREQPLVCVSAASWSRLAAEGVGAYRLAFNVTGEGRLHLDRRGGGQSSTLALSLESLYRSAGLWGTTGSIRSPQGASSPVDRLLRFFSGGALSEASVMNAFDARRVVEYGYGYRGAVEGRFMSVEAVARRLRSTDMLFEQVFARAQYVRAEAEALHHAFVVQLKDAEQIAVPVYGSATRIVDQPLAVPGIDGMVLEGEHRQTLELPAEVRWQVEDVEPWAPQHQPQPFSVNVCV